MSSFFTLPASQRKRKRHEGSSRKQTPNGQSKTGAVRKNTPDDDDSISGSDISERAIDLESENDTLDEDEESKEDPSAKRVRLAEQYLANTKREALEEVGFDAADVDEENLRRRMGDRLKEDTAESRGRLYRFIAGEHAWSSAKRSLFRADTKSLTGIAMAAGYIYTVSKDVTLIKWKLPGQEQSSRKPRKIRFTRGNKRADEHHQASILCVAASADGKFVATGGADNKLIIWDAHELKPLRIFSGQSRDNGHRDSVLSLAFRRSSNQLFSSSKDRTVKVWSCDELAYVETLFGHQDEVLDVAALAKEICVSAGARDRTARYWQVVEETQLVFRGGGAPRTKGHDTSSGGSDFEAAGREGSIDRIAFVDDDTFVTGSDNGALTLWNIHRKKPVFSLPSAHGLQPPPSLEARTAELNIDDQYKDVELMGELAPQPRWITALRVLPYSDLILSGSWDGYVRVFKISSDKRRIEAVHVVGDGSEETRIEGVVNDLAVTEVGDKGKPSLIVAAAVGCEHRLGRWQTFSGKSAGYLFTVAQAVPESQDDVSEAEEEVFEGLS